MKAIFRNQKGFTFMEMMLVIIIIGILAAVIFPRFVGKTKESQISAARLQIENLSLALDNFEMDNGFFPTTEQGLNALRVRPGDATNWKGPYLKKDIASDPWGNPYIYICPGGHNVDYNLISYGPDGREGGGDDITNW